MSTSLRNSTWVINKRFPGGFLLLALLAFSFAFLSPRPPLTINPETLAGDGAALNYCELPSLDGQGLLAQDIPKGNTPGCAYDRFPLPVLEACHEPLGPDAADLRGLWQAVSGKLGHVERIEQCGRRVVITTAGLIHDGGPNATAGESTNDTEGSVLFTLGSREFCGRTSATMTWDEGDPKLPCLWLGAPGGPTLPGGGGPHLGVRGRLRNAHGADLHPARSH